MAIDIDIEKVLMEEQEKLKAEIAKHLENKQIYPAKERIELNDAATKQLFSFSDNFYKNLLAGTGVLVKERAAKGKDKEEVDSAFYISNKEGYENFTPFGEYERAILNYLCTEFLKGNRYVTFAMIQRGISGKIGKQDLQNNISESQAEELEKALSKLMFTNYRPHQKTNDAMKELKYSEIEIKVSAILPACIVRATINGQQIDAVYIDRISPLYHLANAKNQILRYPADLLDVPNQNNTPLVIALKNYCVRRVAECKQHKMTPTLTLDDIFTKCRIADTSRKTKLDARKTIDKLFAHLQKKGFIKSYDWRKKDGKFDAVTFTYTKAKKTAPVSQSE